MNFPSTDSQRVVGPLEAKQEEQLTKSGIHNQTAVSKTVTVGGNPLVSPYECYWSRRALAAEKELQDLKNHIAACLV